MNKGNTINKKIEDQQQEIVEAQENLIQQQDQAQQQGNLDQEKLIEQEKVINQNQEAEKNEIQYEVKQILESDGTILQGTFKDGYLNGQGKIIYKDGRISEGHFINNQLNGQGQIILSNGLKLYYVFLGSVGDFQDDCLNGQGKIIFSNGDIRFDQYLSIREGHYINNQLNGQGKITFQNGQIQEGHFIQNQLIGYGKLLTNNCTMIGYFKYGKLDGIGKSTKFYNQIPYYCYCVISEGNFKNGVLNGQGSRITSTEVQCENGKFIAVEQINRSNTLGQQQYLDSSEEGEFRRGRMNGQGKLKLKNGLTFEEVFTNGKLFKKAMKGIKKLIIKFIHLK